MTKRLWIPIFDAEVWLVVAKDLRAARGEFVEWFGPVPEGEDFNALCSYGRGHRFALFFEPSALTTKTIAHEVFHLTHRILDWASVRFDSCNHETAALLHAYLCDLVCRETST